MPHIVEAPGVLAALRLLGFVVHVYPLPDVLRSGEDVELVVRHVANHGRKPVLAHLIEDGHHVAPLPSAAFGEGEAVHILKLCEAVFGGCDGGGHFQVLKIGDAAEHGSAKT